MSFFKTAIQKTLTAASNASLTNGEVNDVRINTGAGNDMVVANGDCNKIINDSGDDNIILTGDFNDVFAENGNNIIAARGNENSITTVSGNNNIYSEGDRNTIASGNGNNIITSKGHENLIMTYYGDNDIYSEGDANEIQSEAGNQVIESHGDDNLINAGNGSHEIFALGDGNDIVFGDGNSNLVFWGTENIIKNGNGNHVIKTLDWAIESGQYTEYADLIDSYAKVSEPETYVLSEEIINESDISLATGNEGVGSASYTDNNKTEKSAIIPTTAELKGLLSASEKSVVDGLNLSEQYNGSPRYVFAYGSKDKKVHVYDMKSRKSVVKLEQGNNILYTNNAKPQTNVDGVATFITGTQTTTTTGKTSGNYNDLKDSEEPVYVKTSLNGTITQTMTKTTYDFAHMNNAISLGDGKQTVNYTGSGPVIKIGDNCSEESKIVQRDAIETNTLNTIENLTSDVLYFTVGYDSKDTPTSITPTTTTTSYSNNSKSVKTGSPLIVDFNKDGKVSAASGFGVDVDNNGAADGAAVKGDKMLAMSDINSNGKIDGNEVFGDQTVNPFTGQKINAQNGFEALKVVAESAYIATGIKCLNNGEVNLQALKLALAKIGINLGFISDENTSNLEDLAHVKSINIENYINQNQTGDVQHNQLGSYTSTDGNKYKTDDVWFKLR